MKKRDVYKCEKCKWITDKYYLDAPCIVCHCNSEYKPIPRKKRKGAKSK